jgi:hypothetical protein
MSRGNIGYRERDGLGWTTGTPSIGKAERYWNAIRKEEEAKAAHTETTQLPITPNPERIMNWKKSRITMNVWQDADFKITENPEANAEERFRLDVFGSGADPEFFSTIDTAKRAATTLNELAVVKADNERLRAELDERRQADAFGRGAAPAQSPAVAKIAAELVETMAAHDDGRGIPDADADELARQEAYAAEHGDDEDAGVLTGAF